MIKILLLTFTLNSLRADILKEDVQYLNELPLEKLLQLKSSLQDLVTTEYYNVTATPTAVYQNFGAQAMAVQGPPIKRGDYEEVWHKTSGSSKISNIFSMSVTTLAFLAFGGYLLCLIVHAVRHKQMYYTAPTTVQPATFFVSAGIKKKPTAHAQFASYGRRKRENGRSLKELDLPPEQLFSALLQLCEGYAKWNERYGHGELYTH